jgi:hypothetical protein
LCSPFSLTIGSLFLSSPHQFIKVFFVKDSWVGGESYIMVFFFFLKKQLEALVNFTTSSPHQENIMKLGFGYGLCGKI